ncbi:MAG: hypothetical protein IKC75_04715 [Clostridia bacterium]|nr:hypothetical protein [Clostridia bacterium]
MIFHEIYFNDPAITRVSDRGDVAYLIPYQSEAAARTLRRENSDRYLCLNGEWDFRYYPSALDADEHFYRTDFDTSGFDKIPVPSVWQVHGYELPIYLTSPYQFPFDPPNVPYANPMGCYSRIYELEKKEGKKYILSFEGVSTAYYLWVNGVFVCYAQIAHGESGFDVTDKLRNGKNKISVAVLKWADSSYIEDQDMFRHNGIFRDVYILERDGNYVFDVRLDATLSDDLGAGTIKLTPTFSQGTLPCDIKVYSPAGELIYEGENRDLAIDAPMLWTAETPSLYTVTFRCGSEHFAMRAGFRTIKIADQCFLLNGKPIKFRGVNRHDSTADKGFVMTYDEMKRDLLLMKEFNIDTVRTSHYPAQPQFYELCDEIGLYVMCEADMESHGCDHVGFFPYIASEPSYRHAIVERGVKMVKQLRNFSSIVMWSLGNESSWGQNLIDEALAIKALDSRPIQYQGIDNYVNKYIPNEAMKVELLRSSVPYIDLMGKFYPKYNLDYTLYEDDPRPIVFAEYSHAMGNSCGDIWDYWEQILAKKQLCGGMIWEWCDHGLKRGEDICYGGDFGEPYHSGSFCLDGLVSAEREPHTSLYEVKMAYAPVRIEMKDGKRGKFVMKNYNSFRSTAHLDVHYRIEELGELRQSGTLKLHTPALSSEEFSIDYDLTRLSFKTYITFSVCGGKREIFMCQHALPVTEHYGELPTSDTALCVTDKGGIITVKGEGFRYAISKYRGMICGATVNGKDILTDTAEPIICRIPLSNDCSLRPAWFALAAAKPMPGIDYKHPHFFADFKGMVCDADKVRIHFNFHFTQVGKDPYIEGKIEYIIHSNSKMDIKESGTVNRNLNVMFPRYGHLFKFGKAFENITYYGCGDKESYIDKFHSQKQGLYKTTVTDRTFMDSERPMEHGSICNTDFVCLSDSDGDGLLFSGNGFSFHASHYDFHELLEKEYRHRSQLVAREDTYLILDRYMMGVGSASCGPALNPKYIATAGGYEFSMSVVPVKSSQSPREVAISVMTPHKNERSCFPKIGGNGVRQKAALGDVEVI